MGRTKKDASDKLVYDNKMNSYSKPPSATWTLPLKPPSDAKPITREVILPHVNQNILLLRNVLSPTECDHFIKETESLKYHPCHEYPQAYRSNTRVIVTDKELAERIANRISPFIPQTYTHMNRDWKFCGLNECFRYCRYTPGQHFNPHFDGNFTRSHEEKSYYTFMIYLNDSFSAGATRFLQQPSCDVIQNVVPETGMALVFPHATYHDGEELGSGIKYIMRSDLMYRKD